MALTMRWLKRIVLTLSAAILLLVIWVGVVIYVKNTHSRQLTDSWVFRENKINPVIGDLGSILVSIPPHVARFVEYEGDPHFLEPRKGGTPTRSSQSKLRSFGFEVRFPDRLLLTPETEQEKSKSNMYNTMWLSVGVSVEPYNNALGLQRQVDAIPAEKWDAIHTKDDPPALWKDKHGYKRSPEPLYGLIVDEVYGYSEASRHKFPGVDMGDKNIYHHVDAQGHIDTLIECHNVKHDAALCEHSFILPTAKNTMVSVDYRIGLLPQWGEIQKTVSQVILNFGIKPNKIDSSIANKPSTHLGN
jgi:hypothetical protein